jgi:hypothetical protein
MINLLYICICIYILVLTLVPHVAQGARVVGILLVPLCSISLVHRIEALVLLVVMLVWRENGVVVGANGGNV